VRLKQNVLSKHPDFIVGQRSRHIESILQIVQMLNGILITGEDNLSGGEGKNSAGDFKKNSNHLY